MTWKEKLMRQHPDSLSEKCFGGCRGCPGDYFDGAPKCGWREYCHDDHVQEERCEKCWNTECPDTAQEAHRTAENTLMVMLDPGAKMPTRAHSTDAGLDLYSPVDAVVFPRWRRGAKNSVVIDTGVHVAIPAGYVGDVKSKSGLMVNDDIITDGTVDSGYTGAIKVKLFNLGIKPVRITAGQKIAQLVIKKIITPVPVVVDSLEETERGAGGFGSTGKF